MKIKLEPITFEISKSCFMVCLFGVLYSFGRGEYSRSIGFSLRKEKLQDRDNIILRLFLYKFTWQFTVKTILYDVYMRCDCGGLMWKHNGYCSSCVYDNHDRDEYTFVYRNRKMYDEDRESFIKDGYKVEYKPN